MDKEWLNFHMKTIVELKNLPPLFENENQYSLHPKAYELYFKKRKFY
jgi:hypothetical protein